MSKEYPPETTGGIGTQTFLKARALAGLGHAVHVLTSSYDGNPGTAYDGEVVVHRIPDPASEAPFGEPSVQWIVYSQAVAAKLSALHDEVRFDLIEFAEYEAEGFIHQLETCEEREVPVVVMLHGSLAMFFERSGWPRSGSPLHQLGTFMENTVVRGADLLLAASENIADFWIERGFVEPGGIEVVHTAVDTTSFRPDAAAADGRLEVLFVGRIDDEKGVFDVVDAVAALSRSYPALSCRIVGSGDPDVEQRLRARIADSGAAAVFDFAGHVAHDQLPDTYAACDVFASPAPRDHGVASVYLEAMACGVPVIASTSGGAPEAVLDGETGLLVPPDDVGALTRSLESLLTSSELRRTLGRNGRRRVLEHFSVERHVARVLAAYEQVLEPLTAGSDR